MNKKIQPEVFFPKNNVNDNWFIADTKSQIELHEKKVADLRSKVSDIQNEIDKSLNQVQSIKTENDKLNSENSELPNIIRNLQYQNSEGESKIKSTKWEK